MAVERDWTVMAVFDPHGLGGDFAYTVGLADRGLPELHVWARPPDGDDPGEDWKFSAQDCGRVLNQCAERLIAGELTVGSAWRQAFDAGLVQVQFAIGAPVSRLDVEALMTRGDAVVLPVRWSLHRPPVGRLGPVDEAAEPQLRLELQRLTDSLDPVAVAGFRCAGSQVASTSFAPSSRSGR